MSICVYLFIWLFVIEEDNVELLVADFHLSSIWSSFCLEFMLLRFLRALCDCRGKKRKLRLGITNLHNGMILSTLSISSHGFVLRFSKRSHPLEIVFITYKPMIFH